MVHVKQPRCVCVWGGDTWNGMGGMQSVRFQDRLGSAGRPEHRGDRETVIQSAPRKLFMCASTICGGGGVSIQYISDVRFGHFSNPV